MTRNRLYLLFFVALLAGYTYLAWALNQQHEHSTFTPCVFKNATGIACPSCGSTRSVLLLTHGDLKSAFMLNPFGFIIATIMLAGPFWILYDVISKKNTLHGAYQKFEQALKTKWIAAILILLVVANWIWNINKGL